MSSAPPETKVEDFIGQIPRPEEIKERLARNLEENRLLRQLLRLSEQRRKVEGVAV